VIIHGFVENLNDLKQILYRNIGKKCTIKFPRKNTTIYTQNKADWIKVKEILSQMETSYHSFTHKKEKTPSCQNPTAEEVRAALEEEHNLGTEKVYQMRGTKRPSLLVITDKIVRISMLESEVRCRLNTRVMWTMHINNK
jgi:hypothetical protein